jgi:hypothetical protein
MLAPGALVRAGSFADAVWVVRCQAGRHGFWHLQNKIVGRSTYVTRIAQTSELRIVVPAPTFKPGEIVSHQGRKATVVEDFGDEVAIVSGLSRVEVAKSDLVLERL